MNRRAFLAAGAAAAATPALSAAAPATAERTAATASRGGPFKLRYAPHFGMFGNHAKDQLDQLQFAADEGFTAWEDNGMPGRDVATQEAIAAKMDKLGMAMGVFVATGSFGEPTFASGKKEFADKALADIEKAVEIAQRVRAKWCTVVPGIVDSRLDPGFQSANVVDLLRRCCDVIAKKNSDLVMVLEPLNFRDHPNLFLTQVPQAFAICRAVDSPHCKILDDLYHQQITEGNLIPNLERAWSEIAYFQVGDNPGRREPGTGEINYKNVFRRIHEKGFTGIVGMEHGNAEGGKEGERKLIEAYRAVDAF